MIRHPSTVVEESSHQEHISEEDLGDYVDKVENLHEEESTGVGSVPSHELVVTEFQSGSS